MPTYAALPFKANSQGTLIGTVWSNHNGTAVPHPVFGKKCMGAFPDNELPDTNEPNGSAWKQHLGQVTYFTPGVAFTGSVSVYIKFYDNFIGQKVTIKMYNSEGTTPITLGAADGTTIAYLNGEFTPALNPTVTAAFKAGVAYWIQFEFSKTLNKGPGFYGEDGIEGFLAKSWWAINEVPVSAPFSVSSITNIP